MILARPTLPIISPCSRILAPKLFNRARSNFCQLPKPSRFSQQLGLQKKFEKVTKVAKKNQKQLVWFFQFVVWGTICIGGTLVVIVVASPEVRSKIFLSWHFVKICVKPTSKEYQKLALNAVIKHQQYFYINRNKFTDQISSKIISLCIDRLASQQDQNSPYLLLISALYLNLKNTKNQANKYQLYRNFLLKLSSPSQQSSALSHDRFSTMLAYLIQKSDLEVLYTAVKLNFITRCRRNKEIQMKLRERVQVEKKQIEEYENKLKEIEEQHNNILIEPYKFDCTIRKNWLKYIQTYRQTNKKIEMI